VARNFCAADSAQLMLISACSAHSDRGWPRWQARAPPECTRSSCPGRRRRLPAGPGAQRPARAAPGHGPGLWPDRARTIARDSIGMFVVMPSFRTGAGHETSAASGLTLLLIGPYWTRATRRRRHRP